MNTFTSNQLDLIAYEVQPGDNLHRIVSRYYGPLKQQRVQGVIEQIAEANETIKDPNRIRPGQIIKLAVPRQYCAVPRGFPNHIELFDGLPPTDWVGQLNIDWQRATPEERAFMYKASPYLIGSGTTALSTLNTTFRTNAPLVGEVASYYESFQEGDLTKGQYDYRRRKALSQLSHNLGPTQGLLYGDRHPGEVIRISRRAGVAPTLPLDREISRMTTLSKVASRGGVALSVVGLGIACHEISQATSRDRQNDIFVESGGGVIGGAIYSIGASIGIALMATPVGWAGALVIGAGGALAGYAGSRSAKQIYDINGRKIDFVDSWGIANACAPTKSGQTGATQQISSGRATFQR